MEHHRPDATFWRTLVVAAIALLALPAGGSADAAAATTTRCDPIDPARCCFPGRTTTSPNATREPPPAAASR